MSVTTINKVESDEGHGGARHKTVARIREALERAGATFGEDGALAEPRTDALGPADPFRISAARFRDARLATDLRPSDLIELSGLTYPTLRAVEDGDGPPHVARETVLKMVEAYRTVGYRFCANPAADYLDFTVWAAARAGLPQSP